MNTDNAHTLQDLARYQAALQEARQSLRERFSTAEISAVLDVLNGHWFSDPSSVKHIDAEVEDAIRLNGLDHKWHINGAGLVGMLQQLTFIESCALADAAERWWRRVATGEYYLNPEDALAN